MSGLLSHYWTRNLLKETLFLLKKNSMKWDMNYNIHYVITEMMDQRLKIASIQSSGIV